jgi:hypothetical protein
MLFFVHLLSEPQVGRIGLRVQRCERDPAATLGANSNAAVFLQPAIERVQRFAHLGLQLGDEAIRVEREVQRLVVFFAFRSAPGANWRLVTQLLGLPPLVLKNAPGVS